MGFFSALCDVCDHPILNPYSVNEINGWMMEAVSISEGGDIHVGLYDGYGRIDEADAVGFGQTVYHKACWELLGKPLGFYGESAYAPDQGYFFDDEHDVPDPRQPSGM
jgi:hypothetical protein